MDVKQEHDLEIEMRRGLGKTQLAALIVVCFSLTGCSTVTDVWEGTTDAIGSLISSEDEFAEETEEGFPDLASVPGDATSTTSEEDRDAATEGLIADREQAQYTEQVGRREPVDVRPLQEDTDGGVQPQPAAAPNATQSPAETAPRSRPSLAERLGASPPPPPPMSAESAPPPPPVPSIDSLTALTPPDSASSPSATTVIEGSAGETQLAALPSAMSTYDPSLYRVSTHISTITFTTGSSRLTAADRRTLDDVIRLRNQYNGAIRVIGHASSRTQDLDPMRHKLVNFRVSLNRANSVAAALMAKGLPADKLFVGAVSDNEPLYYEVMPAGDAGNQRAEIYLDY